jgi:hypothetical protein
VLLHVISNWGNFGLGRRIRGHLCLDTCAVRALLLAYCFALPTNGGSSRLKETYRLSRIYADEATIKSFSRRRHVVHLQTPLV